MTHNDGIAVAFLVPVCASTLTADSKSDRTACGACRHIQQGCFCVIDPYIKVNAVKSDGIVDVSGPRGFAERQLHFGGDTFELVLVRSIYPEFNGRVYRRAILEQDQLNARARYLVKFLTQPVDHCAGFGALPIVHDSQYFTMGRIFAALENIVKDRRIICPDIFRAHFDRRLGLQNLRYLPHDATGFCNAGALFRFHRDPEIGCVRIWKQAKTQQRDEEKCRAGDRKGTPHRTPRPIQRPMQHRMIKSVDL